MPLLRRTKPKFGHYPVDLLKGGSYLGQGTRLASAATGFSRRDGFLPEESNFRAAGKTGQALKDRSDAGVCPLALADLPADLLLGQVGALSRLLQNERGVTCGSDRAR